MNVNSMFFAIVALICYAIATATIIPVSLNRQKEYYYLTIIATLFALISHAIFLAPRFVVNGAYTHVSLLNISSLLSLLICLLLILLMLKQHNWFLLPIGYLLAFCNIILQSVLPTSYSVQLENAFSLLSHIGLALFSYALLFIVALYSIQLIWLDYLLKHKRPLLKSNLPSLMTLEKNMRPLLQLGVLLLTLMLVSAIPLLHSQTKNYSPLLLTVLAWLLYLYLCWGSYYRQWRGKRIIIYNMIALCLLTLGYFSRRFFD